MIKNYFVLAAADKISQNSTMDLIFVLFIFIMILSAAYLFTKYYAKFESKKQASNRMQVLETITVAPNKYLQLIKVGNQILVIGLSKDTITYLTEVDSSAFSELSDNSVKENKNNQLFDYFLKRENAKTKEMENSTNEENDSKNQRD